jgi:hypothetical protein
MKHPSRLLFIAFAFLTSLTASGQTHKDTLRRIREFNRYVLGRQVSEVMLKYNQDTSKFDFEADEKVVYIALDLGFFCCPRIACKNKDARHWKDIWDCPIIYQEIYDKKGIIKRRKRIRRA